MPIVGLGVHHSTVGAVRDELEATGEISQLDKRKGRDGKARRIVQYVDPTPEGIKGTKLSAKAINEAERDTGAEARRNLALVLSERSAALSPTGRKFPVLGSTCWERRVCCLSR